MTPSHFPGSSRLARQHRPHSWLEELAQLIRLSFSLGMVQVGFHLTGFVDTALAGRVNDQTLAATGLGSAIFFSFSVFGLGIILGLDPIVAQRIGAGRDDDARRATQQGFLVAFLVTLPLTLIILGVGSQLTQLGIEPSLASKTYDYLLGRLPSMWPLLACSSFRAYLQAARRTRPILGAVIGLNIFNLVADWLLIFGDAGLARLGLPPMGVPSLGIVGLAWSSTVAATGQLVILLWVFRQPGCQPIRWWCSVSPGILGQIFRLGTPLGLQLLAEVGVFALVGLLMGQMGTKIMAAHQVAIQFAGMTFAMAIGIGSAASVQVGRAIGSAAPRLARRAGLMAIGVGALFMLNTALVMFFGSRELAQLVTSDPEIIPLASRLLLIAAVFQVVDGMQAVAAGALRGAGITTLTFGANVVGHWLIGLPLGLTLAFGLGLGAAGLWWGLTAGLSSVAIALTAAFVYTSRKPFVPVFREAGTR